MITADGFVRLLRDGGVGLCTGVPCSYLAGPIRLLERDGRIPYVPAVNEGSALAVAAGARLSGRRAVVLAQNSGFGNMINPLTSLILPYRIPVLVMMSMRGWPVADDGEPQHHWMGRVPPEWLDSLGVPHSTFTVDGPPLPELLAGLEPALGQGLPAFVLIGEGAVGEAGAEGTAGVPRADPRPDRDQLVAALRTEIRDEFLFSTTGHLSRALFHGFDRPRNFYMQGSMGHAAGLALGAALSRPEERIVVLDGDGAALMHLGVLASIGHHAPTNLIHVVFDNGGYASTGGQAAAGADFGAVATGCHYRRSVTVATLSQLRPALREALDSPGPTLLTVQGRPGGTVPGRASSSVTVPEIARRLSAAFAEPESL